MIHNEAIRLQQVNEARSRTSLVNLADRPEQASKATTLRDWALVKVPAIPPGYVAIQNYTGPAQVQMPVLAVGFGVNNFIRARNQTKMRVSTQHLIGFYKQRSEGVLGWEVMSFNNHSACFGDSGGPNIVKVGNQYKLFGLSTLSGNGCAGRVYLTNHLYFLPQIRAAAAKLRK